jgi:pyrroline-5-carboxylate reductase
MLTVKLGFLGAGNMAEAIARGVLAAKLLKPQEMLAADPSPDRRRLFERELKIPTAAENETVVRKAGVILVAVKPQVFAAALAPLADQFGPKKLVLSICAGLSTARIEAALAPGTRVVRAMPNTPMRVGRGMAAVCAGSKATAADVARALRLLGSCAQVIRVPEDLMDAVTAISGSGPAYFLYLTERLAAAGAELGLSPDDAKLLARVTFEGTARLLAESSDDPAELRHKVTSPGGTTEAAIKKFEELGLGNLVSAAAAAARDRGRTLGR